MDFWHSAHTTHPLCKTLLPITRRSSRMRYFEHIEQQDRATYRRVSLVNTLDIGTFYATERRYLRCQ